MAFMALAPSADRAALTGATLRFSIRCGSSVSFGFGAGPSDEDGTMRVDGSDAFCTGFLGDGLG